MKATDNRQDSMNKDEKRRERDRARLTECRGCAHQKWKGKKCPHCGHISAWEDPALGLAVVLTLAMLLAGGLLGLVIFGVL